MPDQEQIADLPLPRELRLIRFLDARDQSNLCDQTVRSEDAPTATIARTMYTRAIYAVAIHAEAAIAIAIVFSSNPRLSAPDYTRRGFSFDAHLIASPFHAGLIA